MNVIGLDLGTTSICGVLVDCNDGSVIKSVTFQNKASMVSERSFEKIQNGNIIAEQAREIADSLVDADTSAIGISNQMHGIIYTDGDGRALSPLYTWQDMRGAEKYGDTTYAAKVGSFPGYGLVTDFYNRENGLVPPDTVHIMSIGDFVAGNLTGQVSPMHITNAASLGLFDIKTNCFTADLPHLPQVKAGFDTVGCYRNIPVTVAVGDNQASFMGAVRENSHALVNVGTGSQISAYTLSSHGGEGVEIRPFDGTGYLAVGCALCGGKAFSMAERFIAAAAKMVTGQEFGNVYDAIDNALKNKTDTTMVADCRFCGTRSDPSSRGGLTNIGEDNFTPEDMLQAIVKGMADELYTLYKGTDGVYSTIICSGNGARKNRALRIALSDTFGCDIQIPLYKEEAAYGAALTAMTGVGIYDDLDRARKLVHYCSCGQKNDV